MGRIPSFVRGMVIKEIEGLAEKRGLKEVIPDLIEEAKRMWEGTMDFHSDLEGKNKNLISPQRRKVAKKVKNQKYYLLNFTSLRFIIFYFASLRAIIATCFP